MARWTIVAAGTLPAVVGMLADDEIFAVGYDGTGDQWVGLVREDGPGYTPGHAWAAAEPVTVPGTGVTVIVTASDLYEPPEPWSLDDPACWRELGGADVLTMFGRAELARLLRWARSGNMTRTQEV